MRWKMPGADEMPNGKRLYRKMPLRVLIAVYSCFEKGCRKKAEKCTRQDRKVVWVYT